MKAIPGTGAEVFRSARSVPSGGDYWALTAEELAQRLGSRAQGLSQAEAEARLLAFGSSQLQRGPVRTRLRVLMAQLRSPLLLLLIFAALISALTGEWLDALIVVLIVLASAGFGYTREWSAQSAVAALRAQVRTKARVVRDGRSATVPLEEVVPGDVVELGAGALVPADALILEAVDLFVSEAALTGESFPVDKKPGVKPASAPLRDRTNCVFLGTNVRSGTARCLVARTGAATELGAVAGRLGREPPETEFDRGLRRFGGFLTIAMLVLVIVVFVAHMLRGRPPVETLLFAVALAVGLSPELLPAILSVNLARGAQMMARHGVIVRHLSAIENLGSMDVLCTDKTGTLTEGVVELAGSYDPAGRESADVLDLGAWNAALEAGLRNPLDDAILQAHVPDLSRVRKVAEIPFDFVRKRVSVVVATNGGIRLITKGAFAHVLEACTRGEDGRALDAAGRAALRARHDGWTSQGIRVLAVATRDLEVLPSYRRDEERDLTFAGFLTFLDRPKQGAARTLSDLAALGVTVKLITGDSRLVAQHVAALVGLRPDRMLTGADLVGLHGAALGHAAGRTDLFVEVDPEQKERIILALKHSGHVVGFLGDGVNDAPAMHASDTSLCVDQAVDVAREAADFVLLRRDLDVIKSGIEAGRRTFANTSKYVLTTMSANLGNMVSMAAASLFLPYLPLLAGQVLLNNFLSDIPALGLADDRVDPELVARPERWDMRFIGRFMAEFGVLSSFFDMLTFGALLAVFSAPAAVFRTAWFVESLLTELVIALVVRTRRPLFMSRPGSLLLGSTLALVPIALAIPYLPFVAFLGFVPLTAALLSTLAAITLLYVISAEALKRWFFRSA